MITSFGGVAQLGERLNGIQEVKSSILSVSTNTESYPFGCDSVYFLRRGSNRTVLLRQNADLPVEGRQVRVPLY